MRNGEDEISFLLQKKEGTCVCVLTDSNESSNHAVGIDFKRGLIFDTSEKIAMGLSRRNLNYCLNPNTYCVGVQSMVELKKLTNVVSLETG